MTYELGFLESALKEWRKLDSQTREQFKKKLGERLTAPHVPSARLSGGKDRYKIKLRGVGYRPVYEVHDAEVIVIVVADPGFNADDVDIGDNDEIVWIEGVSHAPDHAVASRRQQWLRQTIFRGAAVITARRLNMSRQSGDNSP